MNIPPELRQRMDADGFPPELLEPLAKLFKRRDHINIRILPREAWVAAALLQFADRNPNLSDNHHEMLRWLAGALIDAIVNIDPSLEPYLLMGWDRQYDRRINQEPKD